MRSRLFADPVHRVPRLWSNEELARIGALFDGDVVNVSAWRDEDKAGRRYRDYFPNARSYTLTNFRTEMRGFQGLDGEVFLNLELPLPEGLERAFDVVYNHTTLEHIYEFRQAFANLCSMSRDVVILVVPWLQPYHSDYGDYWRFSPLALAHLFAENGLTPARIVWNDDANASVYVLAVGVRDVERWRDAFEFNCSAERAEFFTPPRNDAGSGAFSPPIAARLRTAAGAVGLGRLRRAFARTQP